MALTRIQKEIEDFLKDPPEGCSAGPVNGNTYHWNAMIRGPPDTPYEEGMFSLDLVIPKEYPFLPP